MPAVLWRHWALPGRPSPVLLGVGLLLMMVGTGVSWAQPGQPDVTGPVWFLVTGGGILLLTVGSGVAAWAVGMPWFGLALWPLLMFLYALPDLGSVAAHEGWDDALHYLEASGYAYPAIAWVLVGALAAGRRRASSDGSLWPRLLWSAVTAWLVAAGLLLWSSWAPEWWPLGGLQWMDLFSLLVLAPLPFLVFALRDPLFPLAPALAMLLGAFGSPYSAPWDRGDWMGFGQWAPFVATTAFWVGAWAATGYAARLGVDQLRAVRTERDGQAHLVTEGSPVSEEKG